MSGPPPAGRRLARRRALLRRGAALPLAAGVGLLGACGGPRDAREVPGPAEADADAGAAEEGRIPIQVVGRGWHTEVGLSWRAIGGTPLAAAFAGAFPGARHLLFGFGERRYFTLRDPDSGDLLAALAPGPGAIRITPLLRPPSDVFAPEAVVALAVTAGGLRRMARFIWDDVEKDRRGAPLRIAAGEDGRSAFYASTSGYDLAYTCNTWTALALRVAGLPVDPAGVVFAGQVLDRARAAAAAQILPPAAARR